MTQDAPIEWLTVPVAAQRLNCSPRSVYRAIRRGDLRAKQVNERGDYRVHTAWLAEWMNRTAPKTA